MNTLPNLPNPKEINMPKFRKRPVVIEARLWDGTAEGAGPIINWILTGDHSARYHDVLDDVPGARTEIAIDTLEGTITASPGDWIIRGVQGEFYPIKPDIFEATYEPADVAPVVAPADPITDPCGCSQFDPPGVHQRGDVDLCLDTVNVGAT